MGISEKCYIDPALEDVRDRLEEMYSAPFIRFLGIELVSVTPDEVRMEMELKPEMLNSHGVGHGGAVYTLADHTFAYASNIRCDAVGQASNIAFHRPAVSGKLESVSRKINESRSIGVYEVLIHENGKLIASGTFTSFTVKRE